MHHLLKKTLKTSRFAVILLFFVSCKKDYIVYYKRVNEIDSLYRLAHNPQLAIKEYKALFNQYSPKNQERIEEYETYITLSEKYNADFGGKESLYKLIPLIAPYDDRYKKFLPLFNKYGIDSIETKKEIKKWESNLNQKLVDSFRIALIRDQDGRPMDTALVRKNVKKNAELLVWTFKNYGFPSSQKIGSFPMITFLSHMIESKEYYPYIKTKILEYVKSGDCPPRDYIMMVDTYNTLNNKEIYYGYTINKILDSAQINRNRKNIGVPSLKHAAKIRKDFLKKLSTKNDINFFQERRSY